MKARTRQVAGYIAAGAVLSAFQVVVSPMIKSVLGIIVGWFLAVGVATLAYTLVSGKEP